MGIATWHEVLPHRDGDDAKQPRKPGLDEMGPGREAIPYRPVPGPTPSGRSTLGKPGMRGGRKPPRRR
jgi:hypothetical protein